MAAEPSPTRRLLGYLSGRLCAARLELRCAVRRIPRVVTVAQNNELSAGVVVVRWFKRTPRFLLLRVYNYWDFPKGRVEPGEQPIETAVREAREEAGLDDLEFMWGEVYRETPAYSRGKIARYYLARSRHAQVQLLANPELGRPEHHAFAWLSFAEARECLVQRLKTILDWANDTIGHRSPSQADV